MAKNLIFEPTNKFEIWKTLIFKRNRLIFSLRFQRVRFISWFDFNHRRIVAGAGRRWGVLSDDPIFRIIHDGLHENLCFGPQSRESLLQLLILSHEHHGAHGYFHKIVPTHLIIGSGAPLFVGFVVHVEPLHALHVHVDVGSRSFQRDGNVTRIGVRWREFRRRLRGQSGVQHLCPSYDSESVSRLMDSV